VKRSRNLKKVEELCVAKEGKGKLVSADEGRNQEWFPPATIRQEKAERHRGRPSGGRIPAAEKIRILLTGGMFGRENTLSESVVWCGQGEGRKSTPASKKHGTSKPNGELRKKWDFKETKEWVCPQN